MNINRLAVDLAKNVFQVHGVDENKKQVVEKKLMSRHKFIEFVAKHGPCEIIMEACGSANYWARTFSAMGNDVKLISPQYVKPYVYRNKNDIQDARAIMEASYSARTSYVTPKTVEQQDMQSLLRIRSNYLSMRTKVGNQIRGLLKEYGVFIKEGYSSLRKDLPVIMNRDADNGLSPMMKELTEEQYKMLQAYDKKIASLDLKIEHLSKQNQICQRLQAIEGIGPISALAIVALVGDGKGFKNGRHFSAYLGLVPRQHSSGQRERLLGISKRGDTYLRELLVHGGRSVARTCGKKTDKRSQWVNELKARACANKTAVAIANKNARIAMALILSGEHYRKAA